MRFLNYFHGVDRKCKEYLWGGKRKGALVAWEKVCFPKRQGGLNIKDSGIWNEASVGKLIWQLAVNKESMWVKRIHGIYNKEGTFWEHSAPLDSSWYWRKINFLKNKMKHWYTQGQFNLTGTGKFSITSAYNELKGDKEKLEIAELIWNSVSMPKQRFIMWLVIQNRLLTKERLLRLNIHVEDSSCCMCQYSTMETSNH